MTQRKQRMPKASLEIKQKTVAVYYKKGITEAVNFSGYSNKAIYKWVQQQEQGIMKEPKIGRPAYTKEKILTEIESEDFVKNIQDEDKDFVLTLMREILL